MNTKAMMGWTALYLAVLVGVVLAIFANSGSVPKEGFATASTPTPVCDPTLGVCAVLEKDQGKVVVSAEDGTPLTITTDYGSGMETDHLILANKWRLGETYGDDWLRMYNVENNDYYGGFATHRLWSDQATYNWGYNFFRGGESEWNPYGWQTHFPWPGDNRVYIRGDTEIRGNTNNIGDLHIGRDLSVQHDVDIRNNMNVQGKLFFKNGDPEQDYPHWTQPWWLWNVDIYGNNSDNYSITKETPGPNSSFLKIEINDDPDESVQIWGDACRTTGCYGTGVPRHSFVANGDAWHAGRLCLGSTCIDENDLRMFIRHGDELTLRASMVDGDLHRLQSTAGQGSAQFANHNRGPWERMIIEKCAFGGIGDNQSCWGAV